MKQKKVIEVKDKDLVVGEVYCDISNTTSEYATFLRFVKLDERDSPRFEYVSGMGDYLTDHEGHIGFISGETFYKEIETDAE